MKKLDKKKMYMIFGIVMLIISIAGSAYAYYSASASTTISGTAGGGNLTIDVEKLSTSATGSLVPLDNDTTTLNKAILGEGNTSGNFDNTKSCIDKNGYTACQIYKITISNTSSVPIVLNGGVSLSGNKTPNIECAVMNNTNTLSSNTSCKSSKSLANKYSLGANTIKEYYILVYINNIEGAQTDTGNFTGTVTFISSDGAEVKARFEDSSAEGTLAKLKLSVDTSHTPDFTTVSGNSGVKYDSDDNEVTGFGDGTNGVYEAEDDLGTSYYFRGDVQNNYVKFGKYNSDLYYGYNGNKYVIETSCDNISNDCNRIASVGDDMYWRIIRINGDGTIRMIYTSNPNDSNSMPFIGVSPYNDDYTDNTYVGYMYGDVDATTYVDTHKNVNDSTIKTVLDSWYKTNLTSYSSYIADAIYCNDREVVNLSIDVNEEPIVFNGTGIGNSDWTAYANYKRNHIEQKPTLKCKNNNDRFTVSNALGNGDLTYPIGLITTDEIVMGGGNANDHFSGNRITNDKYYLYSVLADFGYATMTPTMTVRMAPESKRTLLWIDMMSGEDGYVMTAPGGSGNVRPVISLKSSAISGGNGTVSNPFYVNE